MMEVAEVFRIIAVILAIWLFGYALLLCLVPGAFRPREIEVVVSALLGLCFTGVLVILPGRLIHDPLWFEQSIQWTVPGFMAVAVVCALIRNHRTRPMRLRVPATMSWSRLPRSLLTWGSCLVLFGGTCALFLARPSSVGSVEFYGTTRAGSVILTVISPSATAQYFRIVAKPNGSGAQLGVSLGPVSKYTGAVSKSIVIQETSVIDLYDAHRNGTVAPLRWLRVKVPGGADGSRTR
jgi:hypothetical protein